MILSTYIYKYHSLSVICMGIKMKQNTKKLVIAAMMSCLSYVLSSFVYFPRMAPFQHMMNVICGVMLGPFWGFVSAMLTGIMRMVLGGRTIQALIGAVVGAFLAAFLYKVTKKLYMAVIGEIIGTGVISALLVYPFMVQFYSLPAATPFWIYIPSYVPSSILGACMGMGVVLVLRKAGAWQKMREMIHQ